MQQETIMYRRHEGMPWWATPLYPGAMEPAVQHWTSVIKETVLPTLNSITDLRTCHSSYQEYRSRWFSNAQCEFDGRYLMECIALHDNTACKQICDCILMPLLKKQGAQSRVCFAPQWPKTKAAGTVFHGMLVTALIEDLMGDRTVLCSLMQKTEKQSRLFLKKIYGNHSFDQGTVQNH